MRVCIFAHALSLWSFGGVAEHTYRLSKQLVKLGCEVHVLCRAVKGRSSYEVADGIHVHRIVPDRGPPWFLSLKKPIFDNFCKQWKFDLFHSQGPCGVFMQVDKPLLVTLHGTSANEAKEIFRDLADLPRLGIRDIKAYVIHALAVPSTYLPAVYLRRIVKRATRIIAVSKFVKEESQKVLQAPREKIEVVYNGVQISRTPLCETQNKEGSLILFVGHLGVRKGLPYLIFALRLIFENNRSAKATIVGEGPLEPLCRSIARKLNISNRITFTGMITEKERNLWYRKADLCVFPSTYEPFPIVALEALAAGKPVVASNIGGLPEIVHNGINGLLAQPRKPRKIAESVNRILSDKTWADEMSKNALDLVEREFNWGLIAKKTLKIYRSSIGEIS